MREVPHRRFTLADAMILVAATATGIASFLAYDETRPARAWRPRYTQNADAFVLACFLLLNWSGALVILRLLRPRTAWWRVGRQPGFVASVAAVAFTLIRMAYHIAVYLRYPSLNLSNHPIPPFLSNPWPFQVAPAVCVAWLTLALSGCWKPEASWIDRLGRLVGTFWIAASVLLAFFWFI